MPKQRSRILPLIPHALTLLRLPLAAGFLIAFPMPPPTGAALSGLILVLAAVSDYLDGKLARAFGTVGNFGKWADPLTDAIFFLTVFLSFYRAELIPLALLLLFVLRELVQHAIIRPLSARLGVDRAARSAGKLKTGLQVAGTLLIVILSAASASGLPSRQTLQSVATGILALLACVSVVSLYWYVRPLVARRR